MHNNAPCFNNATIDTIMPAISFIDVYLFIVHAYDNPINVIMLNIMDYTRNGNISFLRFIKVATELWGNLSTADTNIKNMPIVVIAKKNWAP